MEYVPWVADNELKPEPFPCWNQKWLAFVSHLTRLYIVLLFHPDIPNIDNGQIQKCQLDRFI
jgi:hypothetical protein